MSTDWISIIGAREHNLKNISVRLPRNKMSVLTGLSGSGKSTLAFDTLYAEGQRKYVESLSAYARQFLEQMQKPDVDSIEGLSPAISIEQRTAGSNPRSTVATSTEIHDYFRLLFANIGKQHCPGCGRPVARQTAEEIALLLLRRQQGSKLHLLAPLVQGRKGRHEETFASARRQGYVRARIDGEETDLDAVPQLDLKRKHSIEVVVDRLVIGSDIKSRLTDSVEQALRAGNGVLLALIRAPGEVAWQESVFSEKNACMACGLSFPTMQPRHFSFNSPYGACSACSGLGINMVFDEELLVPQPELSIEDGALPAWRRGGRRLIIYYNGLLRSLAQHYEFSLDTPYRELPERIRKIIMRGSGDELVQFGFWRGSHHHQYHKPFEGVIPNLERRLEETTSPDVKKRLRQYMTRRLCNACKGARLKPEVLACRVAEQSIADVTAFSVKQALAFFETMELTDQERLIAGEVIKEIRQRLRFLADVGLDYLTLDRESGSLSGGEAQRIRLATQIGSGLVGVLYVLDEPSIGLHHRDNQRLIGTLQRLRDLGNTVVVVEHDEAMIRQADYTVDLGPGAGRHGGKLVFAGTPAELLGCADSITAQYLNGELGVPVPVQRRSPNNEWLTIEGARENNLKGINVRIPLGLFVCVTGVSGSGKSTLVDDILRRALSRHFYGARDLPGRHKAVRGLEHLDKVIVIDQSPIGRTPRSNPATYTGAFDLIRALFAELPMSRARGYKPGRYSFNVKGGRCEKCRGDGILEIEMHFLPDVHVTCISCRGRRYNAETLEILYKGRSIADILEMTIDEVLELFAPIPALRNKLQTLVDVGLGYLQLGQSATTLSGGEAQRVKLATELSRSATGRTLYLLDEPTTGLHFADVHRLLDVLHRLRAAGNTVLVVEHNPDVIKTADYIIDLGPEGGDMGGTIVSAGTPEEVAACAASHTGAMLRGILPHA